MPGNDLSGSAGGRLGGVGFGHEGIIRDGTAAVTMPSMADQKPDYRRSMHRDRLRPGPLFVLTTGLMVIGAGLLILFIIYIVMKYQR